LERIFDKMTDKSTVQSSGTNNGNKNKSLTCLIDVGKDKGFVTYDEINDAFSDDSFSVEEMDSLLETLGDMGIDVVDTAEKGEKGKEALGAKTESVEVERVEDPVRIYMREMGAVPLLKREEEIVYARNIEEARDGLRYLILGCPFAIREVLRIVERVKTGMTSLRDLIEEAEDAALFDEEYIDEVVTGLERLRRRKPEGAYRLLHETNLNNNIIRRIIKRVVRVEHQIEREELKKGPKRSERAKKRVRRYLRLAGLKRAELKELSNQVKVHDFNMWEAKQPRPTSVSS
jgi:hypothetical protein